MRTTTIKRTTATTTTTKTCQLLLCTHKRVILILLFLILGNIGIGFWLLWSSSIDTSSSMPPIYSINSIAMEKQHKSTKQQYINNHDSNNNYYYYYNASSPFLKVSLPIIVVGLPKAGTSSLFTYFHCHGFNTQHWFCCDNHQTEPHIRKNSTTYMSKCMYQNLLNKRPIFYNCGSYQVMTEINGPYSNIPPSKNTTPIFMPQHFHLNDIHAQYPNATFVLNQRFPTSSWVDSVIRWSKRQLTQPNTTNTKTNNSTTTGQKKHHHHHHMKQSSLVTQLIETFHREHGWSYPSFANETQVRSYLTKLYDTHVQTVKSFVEDHPSHVLIDIDISNNIQTPLLLNNAIFYNVSKNCWSHVNAYNATPSYHKSSNTTIQYLESHVANKMNFWKMMGGKKELKDFF